MSTTQSMNFEKFAHEGNRFVKELGVHLGHPDEEDRGQVTRLLRAVLHTLRDHINIGQSLNLIASLPMFLKAVYVDQWEYREKPEKLETLEQFTDEVKQKQRATGEVEFDWKEHTDELVKKTLMTLGQYLSDGELENIASQLPLEVKQFMKEEVL